MSSKRKASRTATVHPDTLERERARLAWSVELLAEKSGIHVKTIRRLMMGKPAYLSTIRAISGALGVPIAYLTGQLFNLLSPDAFELNIRTVGHVQSRKQFDQVVRETNAIVTRLRAKGISVVTHDVRVSLPKDKETSERIVLSVEGKRRVKVIGIVRSGTIPFSFWYFFAVKPAKLGELLQALIDKTLDSKEIRDHHFGEVLAEGHFDTVPEPIIQLGTSLNPFAER